jgi:hypothetical protein
MSASWVAGSVRSHALAKRCMGAALAHEVASAPGWEAAVLVLSKAHHLRGLRGPVSVDEVEDSIADSLLWNIRVLAGWLPSGGGESLRDLAGWFEIANIDRRLAVLSGGGVAHLFDLGRLATVSRHVASAGSTAQIAEILSRSSWGNPGGDDPQVIAAGARLSWARRLLERMQDARPLVAGGLALMVARSLAAGRPVDERLRSLLQLRGPAELATLAPALPRSVQWALEGVSTGDDLWRAEAHWWKRVEDQARLMMTSARWGPAVPIGCVLLLAADAHRMQMALESAWRGGDMREVYLDVA